MALTADEQDKITQATVEYSEVLFETCEATGFVSRRVDAPSGMEPYEQPRHFRSVFSAAGDCQMLRNGLLARLAQPVASAGATASSNQTPLSK